MASSEPHTRRRVVQGAAWSLPVVIAAQAAPARAASCVAQGLDWDNYSSGAAPANPLTVGAIDPTTVTRTLAYGSGTTAGTDSGKVMAGPKGSLPGNYFRLGMNNVGMGSSLTLTLSFSQPVYGLTLKIFDIDYVSGSSGWSDRVYLSQSGFTQTFTGSYVTGSGTSADVWRSLTDADVGPNDTYGRVDVAYPNGTGISSLVINYANGMRSNGAQNTHIGVGDLTWCVR